MQKSRKHFILDNPYVAMIFFAIYGMILSTAIGMVGLVPAAMGYKGDIPAIVNSLAIVLGGVLMLAIHKWWFRPEYKGSVQLTFLKDKSVMPYILAFIAVIVVVNGIRYLMHGVVGVSLLVFLSALAAGVTEEVIYRGLIISTMMRIFKEKKSFMPALIMPALLFGLSHFLLLRDGGYDLHSVIYTVISASVAGLCFGAVYLRTGSLLPSMFVHFLNDTMGLLINNAHTVNETASSIVYYGLLISMLVLTVILIKGHRDDIMAVWEERWSGAKA